MRALDEFGTWARGNGLLIVLLVLGSILLSRIVRWSSNRITRRIDARSDSNDPMVKSEVAKHRHVLAQVISWTALVFPSPASSLPPRWSA
jgi:hypothetical protein